MYPCIECRGLRGAFALFAGPEHEQTQPGEKPPTMNRGATTTGLRSQRMYPVRRIELGTSECFTSSDHCGSALKGVAGEAGALTNKPLRNIVEVSFTRASGGPHWQKQRKSLAIPPDNAAGQLAPLSQAARKKTMSHVFVLDTKKQPLTPVHPGRARLLLKAGTAEVYRTYPFTIMLKRQIEHPAPAPLRLKIDPGAKTTGLALVNDASGDVVWAAEVTHRGAEIKKALDTRRAVRRGRRARTTSYRKPRWANRRRKQGWLPPSLCSRVENILTWVNKIRRTAYVTMLSQELVRFDLQKLENPEISDVQYQRGELFGYEVREYALEKWGRTCVCCDAKGVPVQVECIH